MSRIEQALDILIRVHDQNAERLPKAVASLKQLLNAQAALDRQRQRSKDAAAALARLEGVLSTQLEEGARQELELLRVTKSQIQVQQERERRVRSALRASAELAVSQGNLAKAEERLNAALRLTNPSLTESARIRQRLLAISSQQARAASVAANEQIKLAIAQARVATVAGNHAQALAILNRAMAATNLTAAQQARLMTAVATATRAQAQEVAKQARAAANATNQQIQLAIANARTAAAAGDHARAITILNAAMGTANITATQQARLMTALAAATRGQTRAAALAANEQIQLAIAQARVATVSGNHAQALAILNRAMGTTNITASQQTRVMTALAVATRAQARAAAEQQKAQQAAAASTNSQISLFSRFTRVLASAVLVGFALRTAFRSVDRLIVSPVVDLGKNVAEATDQFRRMEASLVGITGSARAARDLTRDIAAASRSLPITKLEAIQGIRGLAFTPGTAATISTPGAERQPQLNALLRTLTGLATIDPEQGIQGAQFAVREALSGEFRSLRFRFEISPEAVAASIGKTVEDLKADPQLTIQALEKFVDTFVGDQAINEFNRLLSTQGKRLRGAFEEFLALVGDKGIYDRFVSLVGNVADAITAGLEDGSLDRSAGLVSNSLEGFVNTLLRAVESVVASTTGERIDLVGSINSGDVDKIGVAVASLIESLSSLASWLTSYVPTFVSLMETIATALAKWQGVPITTVEINKALEEKRAELARLEADIENNLEAIRLVEAAERVMARANEVADPSFDDQPGGRDRDRFMQDMNAEARRRWDAFAAVEEQRSRLGKEANALLHDAANHLSQSALDMSRQVGITGVRDVITSPRPEKVLDLATRSNQSLQAAVDDIYEEIRRLTARNSIINGRHQPAVISPEQRRQSLVGEATTMLGRAGIETAQGLRPLPSLDLDEDRRTLERNVARFSELIGRVFDPANKTSFTSRLEATNGIIEKLQSEIQETLSDPTLTSSQAYDRVDAILRGIQSITELQESTRADLRNQFTRSALGQLAQAQGFISQRADVRRASQSADVLGLVSGQSGLREQLGFGGRDESLFTSSLRDSLTAAGGSPSDLLDPALLDMIVASINTAGDAIERISPNANKGAKAVAMLADTMADAFDERRIELVTRLNEGLEGPDRMQTLIELDEVDAAIEKLRELQVEAERSADVIEQEFARMGQSISDTLRTGFVDTLLDVLNEGSANVMDIVKGMLVSVQRAVLDTILELTLIRGIVNPILNSGLGLSGSNLLPTLGRTGFPLQAGRVIPFRTGDIFDSPDMFPMSGGRVGVRGEDGPEALVPLDRGADGKLGIRGGMPQPKVVHVNMKIYTPDADSFRRTQRQTLRAARRAAGD